MGRIASFQLDSPLYRRRRLLRAVVLCSLLSTQGCIDSEFSPDTGRPRTPDLIAEQIFLIPAQAPRIAASSPADLADARDAARHATGPEAEARRGGRRVMAAELPYLIGSPEGRRFLEAPLPRALARGEPAEQCPAVALAAGAGASTDAAEAATAALGACLARASEIAPGRDCGCRIVALDHVLTIPRDETAYATGIPARMLSTSLGVDVLLVAEETDTGLLLRDLSGTVGRIEGGTPARLVLDRDGTVFEGERIPVGFRRGRMAARYHLTDGTGRRVTLMVGFDPGELAAAGG